MNQKSKENLYRALAIIVPVGMSFFVLAMQWGIVTTKLDLFENRINELINAKEKHADILAKVRQDVAFIKGKMKD